MLVLIVSAMIFLHEYLSFFGWFGIPARLNGYCFSFCFLVVSASFDWLGGMLKRLM
jgi:hypothetical protein